MRQPSRRSVLRDGLVLAGALATPAWFPARRAGASVPALRPQGTTLDATVTRGAPAAGGYRLLTSAAGEPYVLRDGLGAADLAGRAGRRVPVAVFVHLTDIHVIDAQSPARVEFTDRYNDAPTQSLIFESAYRPQEPFTSQLADAVIRGARKVSVGPVTGVRPAFAICTGDSIDNAQLNELRTFVDLLDGALVRPGSGDPARWEGVHDADPTTYDVHYWHPDGTPPSAVAQIDDNARRIYGYPVVPGALEAAQRPFTATGIGMPWYSAFGNHDPLVQGNVGPNPLFNAIAVGGLKVVGLPAGASPGDVTQGLAAGDPEALAAALGGPTRPVTADPQRRLVTRAEIMAEHFVTTGAPVGHGFSQDGIATDRAYYAFDQGALRCIVLDTVNPGGTPNGSIDVDQRDWLESELVAATRSAGGQVDRLVAVFSHHTISTMNNESVGPGENQRRVLGPEVRDLLLRFPHAVLWVNGHTHRNTVTPYQRSGGGGFWEVNTAAHVDYPHQSRLIEIVDNRDGTLSIFGTLVDADAPLVSGGRADDPRLMAALARELSANDWQARDDARRGSVEDRNVELLLPAPFDLGGRAVGPGAPPAPAEPRPLPATGGLGLSSGTAALAAVALAAAALHGRDRAVRAQPGD